MTSDGANDLKSCSLMAQIIAAPVTGDQLDELNREVNAERPAFREDDEFSTEIIAAQLFLGRGVSPVQIIAMLDRMRALSRILERVPEWTLGRNTEAGLIVNRALFDAAAKARLIEAGDELRFDQDEFKLLALGKSRPQGHA